MRHLEGSFFKREKSSSTQNRPVRNHSAAERNWFLVAPSRRILRFSSTFSDEFVKTKRHKDCSDSVQDSIYSIPAIINRDTSSEEKEEMYVKEKNKRIGETSALRVMTKIDQIHSDPFCHVDPFNSLFRSGICFHVDTFRKLCCIKTQRTTGCSSL